MKLDIFKILKFKLRITIHVYNFTVIQKYYSRVLETFNLYYYYLYKQLHFQMLCFRNKLIKSTTLMFY